MLKSVHKNLQNYGMPNRHVVLELTVKNHPGVMSHICGLFSRRAYNLEKILCIPDIDGYESRMWLQVDEEKRLEQVVKQLEKLEDVHNVDFHETGPEIFDGLDTVFD
jgi:acetolactate synthase I/III small subunit